MKSIPWKYGLGALLICLGAVACDQQRTGTEAAQAPEAATEATPAETTTTPEADTTDPYATTPPIDEAESMTESTDISGTETTGDTLGDRCAGLTGQALTDCLETESLRRQDIQDPTETEPTDTPTPDVPQQ